MRNFEEVLLKILVYLIMLLYKLIIIIIIDLTLKIEKEALRFTSFI